MRKQIACAGFLMVSVSLFTFSCRKEVQQGIPQTVSNSNVIRIYVSDIEQLYAAVNDSANAGAHIIMYPGIYILNLNYPNGGRLELQRDMHLLGQLGHAEQVIIDQTALPTSSFATLPSGRTGGIRMGRGTNTIEWITVKGNVNALSAIDTDLLSHETYIRIAHSIVSNSQIGIDVRNRLAEHSGRIIHAEIENNVVFGNTAGFGSGIAFQNANGAIRSIIIGDITGNYIHANRVGFRAFNNAATVTVNDGSVSVNSKADKIEGNGLGMYIAGGLTQAGSAFANGNQTHLEFHNTTIRNNNPNPMPPELLPAEASIPKGAIYAAGGISTVPDNKASGNQFVASFWGCDISGNNGTDINAFGAWSRPPVLLPGANNLAEIYLHGISANAIVVATQCVPAELAGTNVLNIFR